MKTFEDEAFEELERKLTLNDQLIKDDLYSLKRTIFKCVDVLEDLEIKIEEHLKFGEQLKKLIAKRNGL